MFSEKREKLGNFSFKYGNIDTNMNDKYQVSSWLFQIINMYYKITITDHFM